LKAIAIQSFVKFKTKTVKTSEAYRDMLNEDEPFLTGFGETTMRNRFGVILHSVVGFQTSSRLTHQLFDSKKQNTPAERRGCF
jgi:hypothetical protein